MLMEVMSEGRYESVPCIEACAVRCVQWKSELTCLYAAWWAQPAVFRLKNDSTPQGTISRVLPRINIADESSYIGIQDAQFAHISLPKYEFTNRLRSGACQVAAR